MPRTRIVTVHRIAGLARKKSRSLLAERGPCRNGGGAFDLQRWCFVTAYNRKLLGFRPKVLDSAAARITTEHTALTLAGYEFQGLRNTCHRSGSARVVPDRLNI